MGEGQKKVHFLVGDPSHKSDLDRTDIHHSMLTLLLTDECSESPRSDDCRAINTALQVKTYYPNVRMRLMLQLPESKELAVQAGVEPIRCFSSRELKMNIMAQNVR